MKILMFNQNLLRDERWHMVQRHLKARDKIAKTIHSRKRLGNGNVCTSLRRMLEGMNQ
jgi:hypothetical protein